MAIVVTAPKLSPVDRPFRTPGFLVSPETALAEFLKAKLPQTAFSALELITQQIVSEVVEPLLHTRDLERLKKEYSRLFMRFSDLQNSMFFLIFSTVSNISDLFSLSAPALAVFKRDLEDKGNETIGKEATNDAIVALSTIGLVNRKILSLVETGGSIEASEKDLRTLQSWITAYNMANMCVWHSFYQREGLPQSIRVLAYWSLYHATRAYQCARALRLLEVPASLGENAASNEEDLRIAQVVVEDFATRFAEEEATN